MTNRMTVRDFVGDQEIEITPENSPNLLPLMEANEDKINTWFRDQVIHNAIELPLNAEDQEGIGPNMPMVVYAPVQWSHVPEDEKVEMRQSLEDGADEPSEDYTVLRVTINDESVVDFVKEFAADQSLETQQKLAIVIRHLVASNAHRVYQMWRMSKLLSQMQESGQMLGEEISEDTIAETKVGGTD